jgi:Domain of unknown function (DUF4434)
MKIKGTFLDEISHDIPHQNWGRKEWDKDFQAMKEIGIDTVIMIRCGWKRWLTYPSAVLQKEMGAFMPPIDLVEMFLELAEKYEMDFYFGLYDLDRNSDQPVEYLVDLTEKIVDEVWARYGKCRAFKGWYLTQEISRNTKPLLHLYQRIGKHCKEVSNGLPVMISPFIQGSKSVWAFDSALKRNDDNAITPEQHEEEWSAILAQLKDVVDIVAFQDGHVDFNELADYLKINKKLCDRFGMQTWTNCETFDRDMPIKFLPIKWEKMLLKLKAAKEAGIDKAITFEFSHFMSPNSAYKQAEGLYNRYREHFKI